MATSGYFDGSTTSYGWYARLEYSYTQTTTTNITLTLKVYAGTKPSYNNNSNAAYYILAGNKVYQTYSFTAIQWYKIASTTVSVGPNVTSYDASATWCSAVNSTYTPYSLTVSGTIEFPKINVLSVSGPLDQTVEEGETATFNVIASGGSSYTYQWYFGGSAVSNNNTNAYNRIASLTDNGKKIYCVVTSGDNTATSRTATLTVTKKEYPNLYVTLIPKYWAGYPNETISFLVNPSGGTSYTYQWYCGETQISGSTSQTLYYTISENDDNNAIYCKITDASGATIETNKCILRVGTNSSKIQLSGGKDIVLPLVCVEQILENKVPMIYDGTSWKLTTWMIYPADVNNPARVDYATIDDAVVS